MATDQKVGGSNPLAHAIGAVAHVWVEDAEMLINAAFPLFFCARFNPRFSVSFCFNLFHFVSFGVVPWNCSGVRKDSALRWNFFLKKAVDK